MSYYYDLNHMGPMVDQAWIDLNGEGWCAGRIDVEDGGHGTEYMIYTCMQEASWEALATWLDELETADLWSYEQLIETFEKETGHKITWLLDEKQPPSTLSPEEEAELDAELDRKLAELREDQRQQGLK